MSKCMMTRSEREDQGGPIFGDPVGGEESRDTTIHADVLEEESDGPCAMRGLSALIAKLAIDPSNAPLSAQHDR